MSAKTLLGVAVTLAGVCIVAIVRAQDADDALPRINPLTQRLEGFQQGAFHASVDEEPSSENGRQKRRTGASGAGAIIRSASDTVRLTPATLPEAESQRHFPITDHGHLTANFPAVIYPSIVNDQGDESESVTSLTRRSSALALRLQQVRWSAARNDFRDLAAEPRRTPAQEQPIQERAVLADPTTSSDSDVSRSAVDGAEQPEVVDPDPVSGTPAPLQGRVVEEPPVFSPPETQALEDEPASSEDRPEKTLDTVGPARDDILISAKGPTLEVATTGPRTVLVGRQAAYVVTISNAGDSDVENVQINLHIPKWTDVVASDPSSGTARYESNTVIDRPFRWDIPRLECQGRERLMLELVPRESHPMTLEVQWTFTPPRAVAQIEVQEPKLELTLSGSRELQFGESAVYTVTVTNPGSGDAENVIVSLLPVEVAQATDSVNKIGLLKAGDHRVIEFRLAARQPGALQVKALAIADGGLRAEAARQVLVRRARLEVEVRGAKMKYAGTVARFEVRVSNSGDAPADRVAVTAMLPTQAKYVGSTNGGKLDPQSGNVGWTVGTMRPGEVRRFQLQCMLGSTGANQLKILSQAAGGLSAAADVTTQVEALADLKLIVNDPQGPIAVGEETLYQVRIVNRGTKQAEQINVIVFFSDGIEPLAVDGGRADVQIDRVVLEPIRALEAGREKTYKITARATSGGDHVFRIEVDCVDPKSRLVMQETTRFYGDSLDKIQTKKAGPAPPEPLEDRRAVRPFSSRRLIFRR